MAGRAYQSVVIYGGSFDPPHRAHVALPPMVRDALGFEAVAYVPAGRPPHKLDREQTPSVQWLGLLQRSPTAPPLQVQPAPALSWAQRASAQSASSPESHGVPTAPSLHVPTEPVPLLRQ